MSRFHKCIAFPALLSCILLAVDPSTAAVLFEEHFDGSLDWTTSDGSVGIVDNNLLVIGSDGDYDDFVETPLHVDLSDEYQVIIEVRQKLASGGRGYVLPWQFIICEDGNHVFSAAGFDGEGDWAFGEKHPEAPPYFNGNTENPVPGEDYWTITRTVLTASGGAIYMKPDDPSRGWMANEFHEVGSAEWSHSSIEKIRVQEPWDSVNCLDYLRVICQIPGDLDDSGNVSSRDLDIVRTWWGAAVPTADLVRGDASWDGLVNSRDLDIIRSWWGHGTAAIPEPNTIILGLIGSAFLFRRRSYRAARRTDSQTMCALSKR